VPVLVDDDVVIADSMAIIEHLEKIQPDPPLFPDDPARAAGVRIFVEWFNQVYKREPNLLADALDAGRSPGEPELVALADTIGSRQALLDQMLTGREHFFFEFGAADIAAWPFVRYGLFHDPDDDETFHRVLVDHVDLEPHPNLRAWAERIRAERWED
jgi:glutathione S-transferase